MNLKRLLIGTIAVFLASMVLSATALASTPRQPQAGERWGYQNVNYHMGVTSTSFMFDSSVDSTEKSCFNTGKALWTSSVSGISITEVSLHSNKVISYSNAGDWVTGRTTVSGNPSTGHLSGWTIQLNRYFNASRTNTQLSQTCAHELGHAYGLIHSSDATWSSQIMYWDADVNRSVTTHDQTGMKSTTHILP